MACLPELTGCGMSTGGQGVLSYCEEVMGRVLNGNEVSLK
jgi:hypothetical protein